MTKSAETPLDNEGSYREGVGSLYFFQGQQSATYIGTNDTGATDADPTGGGATGNNMVLVSESLYDTDAGCGGCSGCNTCGSGKLTSSIRHVDANTVRTTSFRYDWRGRQEYVVPDLDDQGRQTYTKNYYDNLDRLVKTERHHDVDADGDYPSDGTVDPDDVLLARQETFYDDRGQVYRTRTHAVDPSNGTIGNYLEGNTWYDAAGNTVKQQSAGARSFSKMTYDGLGN